MKIYELCISAGLKDYQSFAAKDQSLLGYYVQSAGK